MGDNLAEVWTENKPLYKTIREHDGKKDRKIQSEADKERKILKSLSYSGWNEKQPIKN